MPQQERGARPSARGEERDVSLAGLAKTGVAMGNGWNLRTPEGKIGGELNQGREQ